MFREYQVTYMKGNDWKLPLNFAIGFHCIVAVSVLFLPDFINTKPEFEDIYEVNLVNLEDVIQPEPEIAEPLPAEPVQQPDIIPDQSVSIAPPEPDTAAPPPKAISIKPLKQKKKHTIVKQPAPVKPDNEKRKRQELAEMIRAQQQAEEQARILAREAELERKMLEDAKRKASVTTPKTQQTAAASANSNRQLSGTIAKQYYAAVTARLMAMWKLPEYKTWDPALEARVVITIRRNGVIADSFFEVKSGDRMFDSFVTKTLKDVGTLPPIPPAMKKERLEVGLRFTPGQIR